MSEPVLVIEQGSLRGRVSQDFNGNNYYSFQGIPYAKPPVGDLRFKAPQPPEPWTGILDATKDGSPCYNRDLLTFNIEGSEDCLFLNVFTPKLPSNINQVTKPVMVYIHGGAFRSGSSKEELYGPDFLITEDVVLVTINYRLGILGFFYLEDESLDVPGNAGMKDMVMALKWVQKNITKFGGDPGNVTIFGESAGGAAVHHLVLSPLAKGLFHKAIAQSGVALMPFSIGRNHALEMAKELNLSTTSEKEILKYLQDLPIEKLYEAAEGDYKSLEELLRYGPVVEKFSAGAFLVQDPVQIMKSGNYNRVPFMLGYTSREGMFFEIENRGQKPELPKNFENFIPYYSGVTHGSDTSKTLTEKIREFYFGGKGGEQNIDNYYLLHTDASFLRDIRLSAILHSEKSPVFLYRFSLESELTFLKKLFNITTPGVCHGDDIRYLFKTQVTPEIRPSSIEEIGIRQYVKLLANFARRGDPNSDDLYVTWKPIKKNDLNFIDIGENLTVGVNPEAERMKFWDAILKLNSLLDIK